MLLIELFPFGRRQMRFELLPLLAMATESAKRPLIVCSVRDVIQSKPEREAEIAECFEHYYDRLLVHGDPRVAGFERSFGAAGRLAGKLHYTGYVVQDLPARGSRRRRWARCWCRPAAGRWDTNCSRRQSRRVLLARCAIEHGGCSPASTPQMLAGLQARAGAGVIVERFRNDFTQRLRNCVLSVSQAGYNTVLETLQAGARAVLVPFAAGAESEQTLRATLLAERGLVQMVEEAALTPATLAAAIDRAAARPRPAPGAIDLERRAA